MPVIDYQRSCLVKDSGYTAVCPLCSDRYNQKVSLIGVARDVLLSECKKCSDKKIAKIEEKNRRH